MRLTVRPACCAVNHVIGMIIPNMITATSVPSPNALRRWPRARPAADYHLYAASGTGDRSGKGDALGRLTGWSRPGPACCAVKTRHRYDYPKYDNRYFGSIAERFEEMARERGLLPIITCTRRRPELEIEAVKAMLGRLTGWSRPGRPIRIKFPRYASRRACQRSISTCRALSRRR